MSWTPDVSLSFKYLTYTSPQRLKRCDEVFESSVHSGPVVVVLFGTTGQFHMTIWYIIRCSHDHMVQRDFRNYISGFARKSGIHIRKSQWSHHVLSSVSPAKNGQFPWSFRHVFFFFTGRNPRRPSPSRSCGASRHHLGATWQFAHWYLATGPLGHWNLRLMGVIFMM